MPSGRVLRGFELPASDRTNARLRHYRRRVSTVASQGRRSIHSHDIARWAGLTPAQVRHDLMSIGYEGNPKRGHDTKKRLAVTWEKVAFFSRQNRDRKNGDGKRLK